MAIKIRDGGAWVDVGGGDDGDDGITIKDEGSTLSTKATTLNFVGSGVVASGTGAEKTITISGGGGSGSDLQVNSLGVGTPASGTTGEIRATNNITAYYSDDRLKTKLGNIENALEKICKLNGFYYEANEIAQSLGYKVKREVGVSAQEVEEILPEIVTEAPISSEYKTIYYDKLIPLLIEAIKEQNESIESLKEEIRKLKE
jgi:hypothetical protein